MLGDFASLDVQNTYRGSDAYVIQALKSHKIRFLIDAKPAIAHNKVIIVDDNMVITGSFNFTYSAQKRNAENVLIIKDKKLAGLYIKNYNKRQGVSYLAENYCRYHHCGK
ncbi:phospholipase D-like domain-containing protein [Piscirickettsia salmonis]|uniref:phospholipase D-like domain-containing protein n=1 Tax=Piscirickettsia salmonis TaxID=1238 RepID=UPI000309F309|nr:phospholipase D-like domain-containing protein [Piscirickettsia salmonis]ERL60671.1 PLD-like domain protein [Piscirickettsia salmonis LF-89 = ATCC VR-1361]QIX56736.1 hypothetical protein GW536_16430 [Piscirickettsia salmonis]